MSAITLSADTIDEMIDLASEFLDRMGVSAAALTGGVPTAEKAKTTRTRKTKADVADPLPVPTELPPVSGSATIDGLNATTRAADPFAGAQTTVMPAADPFASTAVVQGTDPFAGAQTTAASPFGTVTPFAATAMQAMNQPPQFATDALAKLDALAAVHTPEAVYVSWASKQIGLSPSSTVADVKAQILKTDEATLAALLKSAGV